MNKKTFEFLRRAYAEEIAEFLDDPDEGFKQWSHADLAAWCADMLLIGDDCSMNFWKTVRLVGTDYEIARFERMCSAAKIDFPTRVST